MNSLEFRFTNFHNPYSAISLKSKTFLWVYDDAECTVYDTNNHRKTSTHESGYKSIAMNSPVISAQVISATKVDVSTSNKEIGFRGVENDDYDYGW